MKNTFPSDYFRLLVMVFEKPGSGYPTLNLEIVIKIYTLSINGCEPALSLKYAMASLHIYDYSLLGCFSIISILEIAFSAIALNSDIATFVVNGCSKFYSEPN